MGWLNRMFVGRASKIYACVWYELSWSIESPTMARFIASGGAGPSPRTTPENRRQTSRSGLEHATGDVTSNGSNQFLRRTPRHRVEWCNSVNKSKIIACRIAGRRPRTAPLARSRKRIDRRRQSDSVLPQDSATSGGPRPNLNQEWNAAHKVGESTYVPRRNT